MINKEIDKARWSARVVAVLAEHPGWAAATVQAVQAGVIEALDRQRARTEAVSMGLVEALNTKPGHVKRDHEVIIAAIEASIHNGSPWAKKMIERERA